MFINFFKKRPDLCTFVGLGLILFLIFFFGIGTYPLMDIDETRYASMAHDMFRSKDFMTLYLNSEFFFEKPPLYFWLECLSFGLFGKVNEFTVRFPVAMLGFLCSYLVYFIGKKVVSKNFALISSLILATSAEFFILSKFAILDIVLAFCTTFSIFFGFMTLFCEEKNRKWFWWLFYIFSGLAVLAKGIPGFVLPFGTMFFVYIAAKRFKELFKPIFFIPGTIIFFAIVLPWHILMLSKHDPLFFNEYIMKHHIARFTTSADLGRKQPVYFFILTILWGFFPWIMPFLATCKNWGKKVIQTFKSGFDFEKLDNLQKFITMNSIAAIVILVFFSISSSKLITYILPIYPFLACITAATLLEYSKSKHSKNKILTAFFVIFGAIFTIAGIAVPFITKPLSTALSGANMQILLPTVPIMVLGGIFMVIFAAKDCRKKLFITIVAFMTALSAVGIPIAFNIDYMFGQNDLIKFAKMAKESNNTLASFGFGRRFSLNYYYQKHVIYEQFPLYDKLETLLNDDKTLIVVKNKDIEEYGKHANFDIKETGTKYSLIKKKDR